jgi:heme-degrading monooxygenase HmoA
MMMRMWTGWTRPDDAATYAAYVAATGVAGYRSTPGNVATYVGSRTDGDRTEFVTISVWDSLESIRGFAGDDIECAVVYPDDDIYRVDPQTRVRHDTVH